MDSWSSSRHAAVCCLVFSMWAMMSPVTRFIACSRVSVAQHSCPAAQKLDASTADAAQEAALGIAVAGAVATKSLIVGFRNQQSALGTWHCAYGGCQKGHGVTHARAAGPPPEHGCSHGRSTVSSVLHEVLNIVDPATPRHAAGPQEQQPVCTCGGGCGAQPRAKWFCGCKESAASHLGHGRR